MVLSDRTIRRLLDEGRIGIEHFGIEPDLITVAKSIAAGLPLSGVIGRAEIMDAPGDSAIGGTYVGNPVAIAGALAVLDVIEEERLVERAVENAIKFARSYTKRPAVIAFDGGFHGRTLLALSLTSKTHPYKAGLGPFAPEVYRVSFADPYRGPDAKTALAELERAFKTRVAAEEVAAIILEPVQGESGFVVPPREFVEGVRRIADEHGIVLVVDEVQTGFGRTGRLFAIEHFGIEPDLITVAKSIAAGLPLSGVIGRAEIMDAPGDSAIGGTYVGNPVAIAGALAVLDVIEDERLVERAVEIGDAIRARMERWRERFDAVGDIRGLGAMLALELVRDRETKEPDPELATAVVEAASARGLLLLKAGIHGNCIRVLCPLVLSDEQLDEALGVWEEALEAAIEGEVGVPRVDEQAATT